MNASPKLIRNVMSLSHALFATKSNEKRRWWVDDEGYPYICHRARNGRVYDTAISPAAEEDVSFLYGEAPYLEVLDTVTIPKRAGISLNGKRKLLIEVKITYRFGSSPRMRTVSLLCDHYENGGGGHGCLYIRGVTCHQ